MAEEKKLIKQVLPAMIIGTVLIIAYALAVELIVFKGK